MPISFENRRRIVGLKQSRRAVKEGRASAAYVASDAEERVVEPFVRLCGEENVPVFRVDTMQELGAAAGIGIGAAVVTEIKPGS